MTLYVLKYNNYFNKKVLKENDLASYLVTPYYNGQCVDNVSFNPNDEIKTTQVLNFNPEGDYIICTIKTTNNNVVTETIDSRWFILESKRERTGQWTVTLRRDVLVDYYDKVVTAPIFIEKGPLQDTDPYIFNKENIKLNQIKMGETLLKDSTQIPWIVGYIPRDSFATSTSISVSVPTSPSGEVISVNGITNWEFYNNSNLSSHPTPAVYGDVSNITYNVYAILVQAMKRKFSFKKTGTVDSGWSCTFGTLTLRGAAYTDQYTDEPVKEGNQNVEDDYPNHYRVGNIFDDNPPSAYRRVTDQMVYEILNSTDFTNLETCIANDFAFVTEQQAQRLNTLNGAVIYDTNSQLYYSVTVTSNIDNGLVDINSTQAPTTYQYLANKYNNLSIWDTHKTACKYSFRVGINNGVSYSITLSQYQPGTLDITLDSNRAHLIDAPYDMFAIPYADVDVYDGTDVFSVTKNASLALANAIGLKLSGAIYDLQLLPYCPFNITYKSINGVSALDISNVPYINIGTISTDKSAVVLWSEKSNFQKTIPVNITVDDVKIDSETKLYRFTSPNYSTSFDFNAAMNDGLDVVYANCTYKPFNPFLQILPNFKNMYGGQFGDCRGLICGGDYSLPQITSQWAEYELSHKSTLQTFNSRVDSLTFSGTNRSDAISSVLSNLADQDRAENLANIIASPNGLSNTSSLNYNYKYFPILEFYDCSSEEKSALQQKIEYEGMTVNRIDNINNLINTNTGTKFIRGRILRLEIEGKDTHVLDEIFKELKRGVYF